MPDPQEIDPSITKLEQELRDSGYRPVEMEDPETGQPFTRWFGPAKPTSPVDGESAPVDGEQAADNGEPLPDQDDALGNDRAAS